MSWLQIWAVTHGMVFGGLALLLCAAAAGLLWARESRRSLPAALAGAALFAWAAVLSGTYSIHPAYRAGTPDSPKSRLLADPATRGWHELAMEWKEHVAWLSPFLLTAAAFVARRRRAEMAADASTRRAAWGLLAAGFAAAAAAGALGSLIARQAPL
jgi:hypothetical protein